MVVSLTHVVVLWILYWQHCFNVEIATSNSQRLHNLDSTTSDSQRFTNVTSTLYSKFISAGTATSQQFGKVKNESCGSISFRHCNNVVVRCQDVAPRCYNGVTTLTIGCLSAQKNETKFPIFSCHWNLFHEYCAATYYIISWMLYWQHQ